MARLQQLITEAQGLTIADAVTALDLPPPTYGVVPDYWTREDGAVVPRLELEVWSDAAVQLTAAELYGAAPHDAPFADITLTSADATANTVTKAGHGQLTGDGPVRFTGLAPAGLNPVVDATLDLGTVTAHVNTIIKAKEPSAGTFGDDITVAITTGAPTAAGVLTEDVVAKTVVLQIKITATATTVANLETLIGTSALIAVKTAGTGATPLTAADALAATNLGGGVDGDDYWLIKVDADTLQVADDLLDALSGIAIDLSSAGSGTRKIVDVPEGYADPDGTQTKRIRWHSFGLLGPDADGTIDLDVQRAYLARVRHSPRAVAYALKATFGAAVAVTAQLFPQYDH